MDMKKMMEMAKDKKSGLDKKEIQAKIDVLQELMDMADGAEGDSIMDGLQKVTVAAKDKEGLKQGLEKAEEVLEGSEEMEEEDMEESENEMSEDDEISEKEKKLKKLKGMM